jgi:hypothetical protein
MADRVFIGSARRPLILFDVESHLPERFARGLARHARLLRDLGDVASAALVSGS